MQLAPAVTSRAETGEVGSSLAVPLVISCKEDVMSKFRRSLRGLLSFRVRPHASLPVFILPAVILVPAIAAEETRKQG